MSTESHHVHELCCDTALQCSEQHKHFLTHGSICQLILTALASIHYQRSEAQHLFLQGERACAQSGYLKAASRHAGLSIMRLEGGETGFTNGGLAGTGMGAKRGHCRPQLQLCKVSLLQLRPRASIDV